MTHLASIERLDRIRGDLLSPGDFVVYDGTLRLVERVQSTRRGWQVYLDAMPLAGLDAVCLLVGRLQFMYGRKGQT